MCSVFDFIHPDTQEPISVIVEICRDHALPLASSVVGKNALLYFLISDRMPMDDYNVCGKFAIRVDSEAPTEYIVCSSQAFEKTLMKVYNCNILKSDVQFLEVNPRGQFYSSLPESKAVFS